MNLSNSVAAQITYCIVLMINVKRRGSFAIASVSMRTIKCKKKKKNKLLWATEHSIICKTPLEQTPSAEKRMESVHNVYTLQAVKGKEIWKICLKSLVLYHVSNWNALNLQPPCDLSRYHALSSKIEIIKLFSDLKVKQCYEKPYLKANHAFPKVL